MKTLCVKIVILLFLSKSHSNIYIYIYFFGVQTRLCFCIDYPFVVVDVQESIMYYCEVFCLLQYHQSADGAVEKDIQYRCIIVEDQEKYRKYFWNLNVSHRKCGKNLCTDWAVNSLMFSQERIHTFTNLFHFQILCFNIKLLSHFVHDIGKIWK